MDGHPVPIITQNVDTNLFELDEEALANVLLRPEIEDGPVCVLAVAGAFRKGKTFLLDFLLRYCAKGGGDDWLGDTTTPLQGFTWRQGFRRETTGILIWSEPFLLTRDNGDKIAVVLMDTQGTFDMKSIFKDSVVVFALSLLASSELVYNLMTNIQEDDLMNLQTFITYGTHALNGFDDSALYQKLMFLVRDWGSPTDEPYGEEGGQHVQAHVLQVEPSMPHLHQELRTDIRKCFENINCYLMPHPGFNAIDNAGFSGRLDELEGKFVDHLKQLVPLLLAPENLVVKTLGGHAITAKDLFSNIRSYVEVFQSEDLPDPVTVVESMAQTNSQIAIGAGLKLYKDDMKTFLSDNSSLAMELLDAEHERMMEEAVLLYQHRNNLARRNDRIFHQSQEQLISEITALYNTEYKPLVSSQCALKAAKEQYRTAMAAVSADGQPAPQMDVLRSTHEAELERAIQWYHEKNECGKANEAIFENFFEILKQEICTLYDVELMPRSSSRAAVQACKKRYAERMDGFFTNDSQIPTVGQLRVHHVDEFTKALDDYHLRNELARKNPEIFVEYQMLLEEELNSLHTGEYVPRASSHSAFQAAKESYVQTMVSVTEENNPALGISELEGVHEAEMRRAIQLYEQENEFGINNQAISEAYRELLQKEVEALCNAEYKPLVSSRCAMETARELYKTNMGVANSATEPVLPMRILRDKHQAEKERAIQCYEQNNIFGKNNEATREEYLRRLTEGIDEVFNKNLAARSSCQEATRDCKAHYIEVMDGLFADGCPAVDRLRIRHNREKGLALTGYQANPNLSTENSYCGIFEQFLEALEKEIDEAFNEDYLPRASSVVALELSLQRYISAMQSYVDASEGKEPEDLKNAHNRNKKEAIKQYLAENKQNKDNQEVLEDYQKLLQQGLERLFQKNNTLNYAKRELEASVSKAKWDSVWKFVGNAAVGIGLSVASPTLGIAQLISSLNSAKVPGCDEQKARVTEALESYEEECKNILSEIRRS